MRFKSSTKLAAGFPRYWGQNQKLQKTIDKISDKGKNAVICEGINKHISKEFGF